MDHMIWSELIIVVLIITKRTIGPQFYFSTKIWMNMTCIKKKVKNKKYHSHLMLTILAFKKKVLPFRGKHITSAHIINKVLVQTIWSKIPGTLSNPILKFYSTYIHIWIDLSHWMRTTYETNQIPNKWNCWNPQFQYEQGQD